MLKRNMREWKKQEKLKAKIKVKRKEDQRNNGNKFGFKFSVFPNSHIFSFPLLLFKEGKKRKKKL